MLNIAFSLLLLLWTQSCSAVAKIHPDSLFDSRICSDDDYIRNRYDRAYPDALVGHAAGPYATGGGISYLYAEKRAAKREFAAPRKASFCPLKKCPDSDRIVELFGIYGGFPAAGTRIKDLAKLQNLTYDPKHCAQLCAVLSSTFQRHSDTLIAFTTLNHFDMTSQLLESLNHVKDEFDLIFIDDNSGDGTADFLIKRGFAVIRNSSPKGLTYSWNIAYRFAKLLQYKYLFLGNNDVLVPNGAVTVMRNEMRRSEVSIVVPVTSQIGAGHNPAQSFCFVHHLQTHMETYINNPYNAQRIQDSLVNRLKSLKVGNNEQSLPSEWNGKSKFNGFFFAIYMPVITPCEYDNKNLFNPANPVVGQEDALMLCLRSHDLLPRISAFAFVYHFKSRTVSVADYMAGSEIETRNNLTLYHTVHISNNKVANLRKLRMESADSDTNYNVFPIEISRSVFCIATSNAAINPSAGDIMTAREIAESIRNISNSTVLLLNQGTEWYNLEQCDVLIALLPSFKISKILRSKLSLIKILWMRNWFNLFFQSSSLGGFDLVLASSSIVGNYFSQSFDYSVVCSQRCPQIISELMQRRSVVRVETLLLATNPVVFAKEQKSQEKHGSDNRHIDYLFSGNYWNCHREIMSLNPSKVGNYAGSIYGRGWENSPVNVTWKPIIRGSISYDKLPELYQNTLILIDDANHVTKPWGSVNSRVFDGIAGGALVITNGEIGSRCSFDGFIPSYSAVSELEAQMTYFLKNHSARETLVRSLRNQVLQNHTYLIRAKELLIFVSGFGLVPVNSSVQLSHEGICVGIRFFEAQSNMIEIVLANFLAQYTSSVFQKNVSLRLFLVNTDVISVMFSEKIKQLVSKLNSIIADFSFITLVASKHATLRLARNGLFGYDDSDMLLDYMLGQSSCTHIMFSNGDNIYNKAWFDTVAPLTRNASLHLVGWNFVTHHLRNNLAQQVIQTELVRQKVDLGSVLISKKAYRVSGASFLPESAFTQDMFARDYFAIEKVASFLSPSNILILPQILLFHQ